MKKFFNKVGVKQEEILVSRNSDIAHKYREVQNDIKTTTLDWRKGTEVPGGNFLEKYFP